MRTLVNLSLVQPRAEDIRSSTGMGYRYLVRENHTAHTAFASRAAFQRWMLERGIRLTQPLVEEGEFAYAKLEGSYSECFHFDHEEFRALVPVLTTRVLSNASYTLGVITVDGAGHHTVHYMAPAVRDRVVYDYAESRARFN